MSEPESKGGAETISRERAASIDALPVVPGLSVSTAGAGRRNLAGLAPYGPFGPPIPTRRDAVFRRLLALADLLAAAGGLAVVALMIGSLQVASVATLPLIVVLAKVTGRYDVDDVLMHKSTLDEAPRLATVAGAYALAWSLVIAVSGQRTERGSVFILWAVTSVLLLLTRAAGRAIGQRSAPAERVLIVGNSAARASLARRIANDPAARTEVAAFLPLEDERRERSDWGPHSRRERELAIEHLEALVEELDIERVIVIPTSANPETMLDAIATATAIGVKVSIVPRIFEVVGSAVEFDAVGGVTLLGVRRPRLSRSSRVVKRAMDIVFSGTAVVLLAPFGIIIALAIKLDSRGPVFFRQPRIGRNGSPFEMIKFRSMFDGAEAQRHALESLNETDGLFKLSRDPRVTRVGRTLRRTSLDELPQLINVLRGEMSLVGPRPLVPEEDRRVSGRHRGRLQLHPGMTGPWQVLGPERPTLGEMVKLDYLYGANWSLWSDIKILLRTVTHVTGGRGM